jgi:hypothetical protein
MTPFTLVDGCISEEYAASICKVEVSGMRIEFSYITTTHVEVGSNTSTVTLRVIEGDEKGSLKSETVKYGHKSQGTRTRERLRWQRPAAYIKDRPILSSERVPQKTRP